MKPVTLKLSYRETAALCLILEAHVPRCKGIAKRFGKRLQKKLNTVMFS
jgi:hypothetical protein